MRTPNPFGGKGINLESYYSQKGKASRILAEVGESEKFALAAYKINAARPDSFVHDRLTEAQGAIRVHPFLLVSDTLAAIFTPRTKFFATL
ncbi:MAG TPA: hypothetical protein PKW90_03645, partial [Myxococcota bacterium]|nr:hypothetical protein [Myxococcota bacterium]